MILSDLTHWDQEKGAFSKAIVRGVEFLRNTDFSVWSSGTYEIDGQRMYAVVQERETQPKASRKGENHVDYIDIQYVAYGEELIGFARQSGDQTVVEDLSATHDAYLYERISNEMDLILPAGTFAIFFPDDLHRTGCALRGAMHVKKVVVKIHKSLLDETAAI